MSQFTSDPKILLAHDGELADVAALLRELGAVFAERHGGLGAQDAEARWRLVIASARRALELPSELLRSPAFRVAFLDGRSRTVQALLRRASFELVVKRPVHPMALRLLLLHVLYRGPEKRRTPRVSVGAPVRVRAGLRRHRAILAELSERGCRLLGSQRALVGQTLTLQIPASLAGGRAFSVKGLVVRVTPAQVGVPGVLTLAFDGASAGVRTRLRAVVAVHAAGPSALCAPEDRAEAAPAVERPRVAASAPPPSDSDAVSPPESAPDPEAEVDPVDALDAESDAELLEADLAATPRRSKVPLSDEAARVLLARGLSREGMRADPSPRLARAGELGLALHVEAEGPPLLVRVHVEPDDSEAGPFLRFKDLAPVASERLDSLLAGLSVFVGEDGPEHALVVCEILDPPQG